MRKKILITLALLIAAVAFALNQFSLTHEIEKRLEAQLTAQGLSDVKITLKELDQHHALFSHIRFKKEKMEVVAEDLDVIATALPVPELLRGNYSNVKADWKVKSLTVTGIAYELPPLTGAGNYYTKDKKPVVVGEMHDEKRTHSADFTVTSVTALLENIRVAWKDSVLKADAVVIAIGKRKSIYIPLRVESLPLNTLLSLISSKASGSGTVSGSAEVVIHPDNSFTASDGKFGAGSDGVIKLSADTLPGDSEQVNIARQALSNFHYKDLSVTLVPGENGKVVIRLNIEGNNPDAFDGRLVKLNVNLSGDVLELLQQTILPMADPQKLIEKGNQ